MQSLACAREQTNPDQLILSFQRHLVFFVFKFMYCGVCMYNVLCVCVCVFLVVFLSPWVSTAVYMPMHTSERPVITSDVRLLFLLILRRISPVSQAI